MTYPKTNNLNQSNSLFKISATNFFAFTPVFLFFILSIFSHSAQAALTQSIDRHEIHAGETFLFTIQIDEDTGAEPDLSLIPKEFTIVSNSQYQQVSYANGRSSVIKGWKLKLSTLKTGKITIPSITVGNDATKPVTLFIKDTSDRVELNGKEKAIFLESNVDLEQVYVQQQVLLTIKLYRAVNTHYARLTEPTAGDSIVEKLGDDIQYDKTINNTRYVITERKYAIFPQHSGELEISAVNFTADVNDSRQSGRNRFLNTTRPISVNSKPIKLNVSPQPAQSSNPWMPSSEVVLADKWSTGSNDLVVGEPVTWTLLLYAQGLSESQLPEIALPKVDGFQWYPDTPQKDRQVNEKGILGQRVEKLAVIPSKEGTIIIPEIHLKWWDTKSDSEKTATIAKKTFNVLPAVGVAETAVPPQMIGPKVETKTVVDDSQTIFWKSISAGAIILWLLTLIAYFQKKSKTTQRNNEKSKEIVELSPTQSSLQKSLLKAIELNHTSAIESSLLEWCSSLSEPCYHSLGHLLHKISDQDIIDKISKLENQRYAANKSGYQCDISKSDLEKLRKEIISSIAPSSSEQIPGLYAK